MTEAALPRQSEVPAGLAPILARVLAVPLVGFLLFGVLFALGFPRNQTILLGLTVATGTLCSTVIAVDRVMPRERRNLLLSIFSFSYLSMMVIPNFVFYLGADAAGYTNDFLINDIPLTEKDVTLGMLAAFVGYAMLLVGYAIPVGRMAANIVPRMEREWSPEATLAVALVATSLGWAVVLAGQFGLIPERAGSGVLGAIAMGASLGIGLVVLCYQRYRSRAALLLLLLISPPTMMFNFFTSAKLMFLMPFVMIAIVHIIVTRRLRVWWIVGFLVLMPLFYPLSQTYRDYLFGNRLSAVQVIAHPQTAFNILGRFVSTFKPKEYFQEGTLSTFNRLNCVGILSVIVRDTGTRVPFQGGWTIGYIPMAYVPRLLWADKPKFTIGGWVTENFGGGPEIESSTGSTWMGELFFNFGWTGLILGMIVIGIWFRFLQDSFLRIDATIPAMLAGVVAILTLAVGLEGSLLHATNSVIFNVAPIMLTHLVVRTITPRPAHLPPPL